MYCIINGNENLAEEKLNINNFQEFINLQFFDLKSFQHQKNYKNIFENETSKVQFFSSLYSSQTFLSNKIMFNVRYIDLFRENNCFQKTSNYFKTMSFFLYKTRN